MVSLSLLSLVRLKPQQKDFLKSISNSHITLSSYSFGIDTLYTLIHNSTGVPSQTISNPRPKWAKSIPIFRPKRCKNPTLWGDPYLHVYGLYKGVALGHVHVAHRCLATEITESFSILCLAFRIILLLF